MPEDYTVGEDGVEKTPEQIEAERTAEIANIKYDIERFGDDAFDAAMTELILKVISYCPIQIREAPSNGNGYPLIRTVDGIESLFTLAIHGNKDALYNIPTKYGIRDKMSDIYKAAYKHKFEMEVGPIDQPKYPTPEQFNATLSGQADQIES